MTATSHPARLKPAARPQRASGTAPRRPRADEFRENSPRAGEDTTLASPSALALRRLANLLASYTPHDGAFQLRLPGTWAVRLSRTATEARMRRWARPCASPPKGRRWSCSAATCSSTIPRISSCSPWICRSPARSRAPAGRIRISASRWNWIPRGSQNSPRACTRAAFPRRRTSGAVCRARRPTPSSTPSRACSNCWPTPEDATFSGHSSSTRS